MNTLARDGQPWWTGASPEMVAALGHCGRRGLAIFPRQQLVVSWNDAPELQCDRALGSKVFQAFAEAVPSPSAPAP